MVRTHIVNHPDFGKQLSYAVPFRRGSAAHKGRHVKLLIADQSIRVITLEGELLRELTLDPSRNYQPLTRP